MVKEKKEREEMGMEEELRKYRLIVESAQDAIFVKDLDSHYTLVNQKCLEAFGKSKQEEVLGKRDDELLPPKEAKINIEHDQKVFKTGKLKEVTKKMTAGGKERWFQAKKVPLRDNQGEIIGLIGVARDITERKKAEEILRENAEKFRVLAEESPNMIYINQNGRVVYANKKCAEVMGYKRDEFYSPNFDFLTLIAPEYRDLVKSGFSKHMKGEEVKPYEYALITKEGKRIDAIHLTKLMRYGGESALLGIITDITERKRVEERVKESERKYRDMVEVTTDWVWEVDKDGMYTYVSPKVKDILGYEVDEVIGKTPFDLMPKDEAKKISKFFREKAIKKEPFFGLENINRHKEGHLVILETSSIPILDKRGELIGYRGIDRDITERKKMEKMLWKTEEQHKKAIENIFKFVPESLLVFTDKLDLYKKNKAFQNIIKKYSAKLNYTEQELAEIIIEKVKNRIITGNNTAIRVSKK